jgi:hypothetical protein
MPIENFTREQDSILQNDSSSSLQEGQLNVCKDKKNRYNLY